MWERACPRISESFLLAVSSGDRDNRNPEAVTHPDPMIETPVGAGLPANRRFISAGYL